MTLRTILIPHHSGVSSVTPTAPAAASSSLIDIGMVSPRPEVGEVVVAARERVPALPRARDHHRAVRVGEVHHHAQARRLAATRRGAPLARDRPHRVQSLGASPRGCTDTGTISSRPLPEHPGGDGPPPPGQPAPGSRGRMPSANSARSISASSSERMAASVQPRHGDFDIHAEKGCAVMLIGTAYRHRLGGRARGRNADEVAPRHDPVRRVELHPAGARDEYVGPGMRRATTCDRLIVGRVGARVIER